MTQEQGPRFGLDAPAALGGLATGAGLGLVLGAWALRGRGRGRRLLGSLLLANGVVQGLGAVSFLYTTLRGKLRVWEEEVSALRLTGAERVVDLGCGRGVVLVTVARRLTTGRVTGVDLWQARDQSGNTEAMARANAEAAGVADRVELVTADLRDLPLPDDSADLVVSSLAVHNIPSAEGRVQAVREAWRVLAPGGRLRLADFRHTGTYAQLLREAGAEDVTLRDLGPRYWYGGPWARTVLVSALKPVERRQP